MKTIIIVQARMTSTRLPAKIMMTVLGKSLLEHQIIRLRRVNLADDICIACTTNKDDEPIVNLAKNLNVPFFRGSEHNVLSRYYGAALEYKAEHIVRVTSDCPIIDPIELDYLISSYHSYSGLIDYTSSGGSVRSYPRGMEAEIFSMEALSIANQEARENYEFEHVTPFIYTHPEKFKISEYSFNKDESHHRWTVDTIEDFQLVKKIIEELFPKNQNFTIRDVLALLSRNPSWIEINSHVRQKGLTDP